jgi:hypothetical protein
VDEIVRLWTEARPDLDSKPMAPIGRILRLARHFERELAPVYRAKGLDFGLFDVLATLRRVGPPYRLTAGELDDWCMVTSGGMTARLQRLEEAGSSPAGGTRWAVRPGPAGLSGLDLIDEPSSATSSGRRSSSIP